MLDYRVLPGGPTVVETREPLPEVPADAAPALGVRRLRGDRMTDLAGVYDECAAALQFPTWFGHNLDAFDECLRDLDLPEAAGGAVVLVVADAPSMLSGEFERRPWFPEAVADANAVRSERGVGPVVVVFSVPESAGDADRWWREGAGSPGVG